MVAVDRHDRVDAPGDHVDLDFGADVELAVALAGGEGRAEVLQVSDIDVRDEVDQARLLDALERDAHVLAAVAVLSLYDLAVREFIGELLAPHAGVDGLGLGLGRWLGRAFGLLRGLGRDGALRRGGRQGRDDDGSRLFPEMDVPIVQNVVEQRKHDQAEADRQQVEHDHPADGHELLSALLFFLFPYIFYFGFGFHRSFRFSFQFVHRVTSRGNRSPSSRRRRPYRA